MPPVTCLADKRPCGPRAGLHVALCRKEESHPAHVTPYPRHVPASASPRAARRTAALRWRLRSCWATWLHLPRPFRLRVAATGDAATAPSSAAELAGAPARSSPPAHASPPVRASPPARASPLARASSPVRSGASPVGRGGRPMRRRRPRGRPRYPAPRRPRRSGGVVVRGGGMQLGRRDGNMGDDGTVTTRGEKRGGGAAAVAVDCPRLRLPGGWRACSAARAPRERSASTARAQRASASAQGGGSGGARVRAA